MDRTLHELDEWLTAQRAEYRAALRPGADDATLARCEATLGRPLPEGLRALYRWHDGQASDCLERLDRFGMYQSLEAVLRTIEEMNGLAETGDFPHEMWWRGAWFPFLWSGGGDYLCVDLEGSFEGRSGQILLLVGDELERIIWFPDLGAWLGVLVEGLRSGALVVRDGDVEPRDPDGYQALVAARYAGFPRTVELELEDVEG